MPDEDLRIIVEKTNKAQQAVFSVELPAEAFRHKLLSIYYSFIKSQRLSFTVSAKHSTIYFFMKLRF